MRRAARGFTLVETLVATALSLGLLAFVMSTWAALNQTLGYAADHAAVSERAAQGLSVIADAADRSARAPDIGSVPPDPCASPVAESVAPGPVLTVTQRGSVPCFPSRDMPSDAPLLMIDTLVPCDPECPDPESPGFLYLEPGCHPVLARTSPEIRQVARLQRPADCSAVNRISQLQRQLYYYRDYAWQPGDGLGALMVKQLRPESPVRWGRAEMLVAGVQDWRIIPLGTLADIAMGIEVSLQLRGWMADAALGGAPPEVTLTRTLPARAALIR